MATSRSCLLLIFLAAVFIPELCRAGCSTGPSPGAKPNTNPVDTGAPHLIKTIHNGKLFTVGSGEDSFNVVHVYGTPYEMGYAHGALMKEKAQDFVKQVWTYMEDQIVGKAKKDLHWLAWFLDDVATFGLDAALELEYLVTKPYTRQSFYDELRGLADGAQVDYKRLVYIHLIGELTKGACSMIGAWGGSLASNISLLQLRALDWAVDGPFKDFPQVTVYHPSNSSYGYPWANFGWTGWIGSITGMNSYKMAISEIGVAYPDSSFGKESRFGVPFTVILRDILQFDTSIDAALNRINSSSRTCDLILGVGDGMRNKFRGIEYSASIAKFMDDKNLEPQADWHPKISEVVYWGMDWVCPGYDRVLAQQLQKYHGSLDPGVVMRDIVSIVKTGNLQVAVYDLTHNLAYLANGKATYESGPQYAYDRQFVRLNMTQLFMEPVPKMYL